MSKIFTSVKSILEESKKTDFVFEDIADELSKAKKETLMGYIRHLLSEISDKDSEIKSKDSVISHMAETFKDSLEILKNTDTKSIVVPIDQKIDKLQTSVDNMSLNKINNSGINHQSSAVITESVQLPEPYLDYNTEFLDNTTVQEIVDIKNENAADFQCVGKQRKVLYYGKYSYKYAGVKHEPKHEPPVIEKVRDKIREKFPGKIVGSCMYSLYHDGNSFCPSHSDNEGVLDPESDIFTISLLADRCMMFSSINGLENKSLLLAHNSLLRFNRRSQDHWKHSIPIDTNITSERISLTFRVIAPHFLNSTVLIGDSNARGINFGDGPNCLGKWVPGKYVKASTIEDIPTADEIGPYRNVIIHTGINDITKSKFISTDQLVYQLELKCSAIHKANPAIKIFLSPALPTRSHNLNARVSEFNECIVTLSKKHHNLMLIDNSIFLDKQSNLLNYEYSSYRPGDMIHLNKLGSKCFAMSLKSYILGKNENISRSLNFTQAFRSHNY